MLLISSSFDVDSESIGIVSETDYSQLRGVADERNWNEFVLIAGGQPVGPLIKRPGVKNADYIFPSARVIVELKVLQTDFAQTKETLERIDQLLLKFPDADPDDPAQPLRRELLLILRKPLQRILNSANRQIKETKRELGLSDWWGVTACVNDGFRSAPPPIALGLLANILSRTSYSNTDALIYLTNHYVEVTDNPYANLLWYPTYSDRATDELVTFINDLGRKWRKFTEEKLGPYDLSEELNAMDISEASVVTGVRRNSPYRD